MRRGGANDGVTLSSAGADQLETVVDDYPNPSSLANFPSTSLRLGLTEDGDSSQDQLGVTTASQLYAGSRKRFGRYLLLEELGRGGMGIVHAAYDERLGRKVAIKFMIELETQDDPKGQARLLREAQAMARLTHPNIVTVFDVGRSPEGVFLAMEYVPGQTLADWLKAEHPSWRVIRTFIEAGRGLAAAHDEGIIHRDFKPGNVLIGRDGRVKVADFGLAAIDTNVEPSTESSASARELMEENVTKTGARIGTPAYMAPEQHLGRPTSGLSDQFSYCVSLWEAIFGQHPFPGPSAFARAERITAGKIEPPAEGGRASEAVRAILEKGLSPVPEERHRSMRELLHLLESTLTPGTRQRAREPLALNFGVEARSLLGGRYSILEAHPANPLLHVTLDRQSGTFAAIEWTGGRSAESPNPTTHREIRLADQFRAISGVSHPHIIGSKDFGYDNEYGAFLVHQLPRDAALLMSELRRASFDVQINLLVDVMRAVGFLHTRRTYGMSLSPADVVVVGGRAQLLLQFLPRGQRGGHADGEDRDVTRLARLAQMILADQSSGDQPGASWANVDVSDEIRAIFTPLLNPGHGVTARELVDRLAAATGRRLEFETVETREAFLRSTSPVGRSSDQLRLKRLLLAAVDSRGSMALVRGESGIGKSRFVDEFRTVVLDSGNRFFKGQAESDGAVPYQLWRGALRALVAESVVSEYEASVLAWIVPDVAQLVDQPIQRAVELDGQAMRQRLTEVVLDLFRHQTRALVLVLEDIQWADPDSLLLLEETRKVLKQSQLLIILTSRTENGQEGDDLETDETIELDVLDLDAVQRYTRRLIGERPDSGAIAEYVYKHSEGNPLFLTEVFRAMADEAGALVNIRAASVPKSPKTGGLRRAIQERLARLPAETLPLLQIAAIIGRNFEPEVIEEARPNEKVGAWLGFMRTPAVIEQRAGQFRFAHDKLREAVLDQLDDETRRALHVEVAQAMEKRGIEATRIAHHFLKGGDPRAAKYAGQAGRELVHASPEEAARLLEIAIEKGKGEAKAEILAWRHHLADALFDAGKLPEAAEQMETACAEAGKPLPRSRWGFRLRLMRELLVQLAHLVLRTHEKKLRGSRSSSGSSHDWARSYDKLAEIAFFRGENLRAMTLCMMALNEGDRRGAVALNSLGIIAQTAAVLRLGRLSERYFSRGRAALVRDESLFHPVFFLMEIFAHTAQARFEEARQTALRGYDLGLQLGHTLGASQCMSALGLVEFHEGKFSEMLARFESIFELKEYNQQHDAGPSGGASLAHAMLGNEKEARRFGERAMQGASEEIPVMGSSIYGGQALVYSRFGMHQRALELADRSREGLDVGSYPSVLISGLLGPMDAYLSAWRNAREFAPHSVADHQRKALKQLAELRAFARMYPLGRAFALQAQAQVLLLLGKGRKARGAFQRALAVAERNGLEHRVALIRMELARLAPRGSQERDLLLGAAAAAFQRLQTAPDVHLVEELRQADVSASTV